MKKKRPSQNSLLSLYWPKGLLLSLATILAPFDPIIGAQPGRLSFLWLDRKEWKGKAEIATYSGTVIRYRQKRNAALTLITVVEPFNLKQLVKSEQNRGILVLKQNQALAFQTGVYPYNQMNSIFWRADGGELLKATMSSQEWCGQTFKEVRPEGDYLQLSYSSYWENEARGYQRIPRPKDRGSYATASAAAPKGMGGLSLLYDELALAVRSPEFGSAHRLWLFPLLMSSQVLRPDLDVGKPARKPAFFPAKVAQEETRLQLGSRIFSKVARLRVSFQDIEGAQLADTFYVDLNSPNRTLLRWDRHDGSRFVLKGLYFSDYWNQNKLKDRLQNNQLAK